MDKPYFIDVLSVGQSKTLNADFDVASIAVDNPTGCWLLVEPLERYIPPNRIGWRANLSPTAKTITIRFVDAPTGGVASVITGGPIVVTVSDYESDMDIGDDYRLVNATENLITSITGVTTAINSLQAGWGSTAYYRFYNSGNIKGNSVHKTLISAPGAGASIVLLSYMMSYDVFTSAISPSGISQYHLVNGGGGSEVGNGCLTFQHPSDIVTFPPNAIVLDVNTALEIWVNVITESVNQYYTISGSYYII